MIGKAQFESSAQRGKNGQLRHARPHNFCVAGCALGLGEGEGGQKWLSTLHKSLGSARCNTPPSGPDGLGWGCRTRNIALM